MTERKKLNLLNHQKVRSIKDVFFLYYVLVIDNLTQSVLTGAMIGEVVTYEGLPPPEPLSGAQVDKKKVFLACLEGMKTTEDKGLAAWNGHIFQTSAGPCKAKTICGGVMR